MMRTGLTQSGRRAGEPRTPGCRRAGIIAEPQPDCLLGVTFPAQRVLAGEAVVDVVVDATKHRLVITHPQSVELFTKVAFDQKLMHGCLP
jgi:hypothetical protein